MASIRDPIHGSIHLDDWVIPLIDHREFQRLRRVQQLGTAHLVYPGANHRRFEHSLGAYHLAGEIATSLGLDPEDAATVRAGALLHDIGHGPFSHAFEELWEGRHEDIGIDLVRWGPLGDLLRQGGLDPVKVAQLIAGEGPLAKVVSGALDADRMDYLLRDAHYTGVRTSVDPDRLLRVLERDETHGTVLRESGLLSAESLLTMRFLMYPAVYLHHTVRASERMLQAAIAHAAGEHFTMDEAARDTDDALLHRLRAAGGASQELVSRLDDRRLYKRAWEVCPAETDSAAVRDLAQDLTLRDRFEAEVAEAAGLPAHQVLLDAPHQPRFREMDLQVKRRDGALVPIREASQLVRALDSARSDHWRFWVFAPKQHLGVVGEAARKVFG